MLVNTHLIILSFRFNLETDYSKYHKLKARGVSLFFVTCVSILTWDIYTIVDTPTLFILLF